MRWRIQGSDVGDGSSVLLDIEAESAVDAVAHAHGRRVVVSRVFRAGGRGVLRAVPYVLAAGALGLGVWVMVLHGQRNQARQAAHDAVRSAAQSAEGLAGVQAQLAAASGRVTVLEMSQGDRERERTAEMQLLMQRVASAETAAKETAAALDVARRAQAEVASGAAESRKQVEALRRDLAAAEGARKALETASAGAAKTAAKERERLARELAAAQTRASESEKRGAVLDARISELAARLRVSEDGVAGLKKALDQARESAGAPPRHALAIGYDAALDFAALHMGKVKFDAGRGSEPATVTAAQVEHANVFTLKTDKERVYEATLLVCLAADAPKAVLADNRVTLAKYVALFAPQWKDADAWLKTAFENTAGKGEWDRAVLLTERYRVSVWGNKDGQWAVKIEPRAAGEQ